MPGVTKEQIQAAREADLFAYLQFHEPGVLKRDGPNYRHKEHDSLVYVTGKRYWYWNSRGRSINALDYLIQIRGYGLVDAVHTLVSDNTDNLRFMSLDWLESKGFSVDRDHYQMVYARQREPGETLEDIYRRFNIDHPEDFRGHSLSVSDVVILHENGADAAYYVDSIGFKELPGFFDAGAPEARRDVSVREQLDNARKQAAQTEPKAPDKRPREPERS